VAESAAETEIAQLKAELTEIVFDRFEHDEAFTFGEEVIRSAVAAGAAITVDVRKPEQILYHRALPGTTADNEHWIRRKAASVFRWEVSSLLLGRRFAAMGFPGGFPGFDAATYASAGGSFPIRVRGAGVVAAATVSGVTEVEDHAFVVQALRTLLAAQAEPKD
jgi:uncharacterized protein (UPF0303 family)